MKGSILKPVVIIPAVLGMILSCFFYYLYFWNDKKQLSLPDAVEITNQPLPTARLNNFDDNTDYSEKVRTGKVLLIFLTTGCNACQKEADLISKNYSKLSPKIKIYGVGIEEKDKILVFISKHQIQFPILIDDKAELFRKLQIKYFPTKFLIEDGIITRTWFGNFSNEEKLFQDLQIGDIEQ